MGESREIEITTYVGNIAAKVWGPEDGKPLLAIHGWLDNAASFDRLAPLLLGYRIVAPDLPGHGRSYHRPGSRAYHFVDWPDDILAILRGLNWTGSYTLVGHSLGGGIAAMVAALRPAEVSALVMLDSLGPYTSEADALPERYLAYLDDRAKLLDRRTPVYPDVDHLAKIRQRGGEISFEASRLLVERAVEPTKGGITWTNDPALRLTSPARLTEAHWRTMLDRIRCPTLFIRARSSQYYATEQFKQRLAHFAKLQSAEVEGNHHVHIDDAEAVATPILNFLKTI